MKPALAIALAATAGLALLAGGQQPSSPFAFGEASRDSLVLTENGQPVFVYNHGMILAPGVDPKFRRSCYLHPVYAPDGTVLTDDFPTDHRHHRGICWSWPKVTVGGVTHDVWALEGMEQRFVAWLKREVHADRAALAIENGWYLKGSEQRLVREIVEITAYPAAGSRRHLDFQLSFEALNAPVEISGREKKGYGGFGARFAPRTETVIRTEAGIEEKGSDLVPHPWAELEAVFENGRRAGLRIEDHPDNPGSFPVGWCLRHYGYIAANYPGLEPVTLMPGEPLTLRYRVTVFSAT